MTEEPASARVTLLQILDLALGTPEVGSVNFNILHTLLHILLNELNLTNNNVEYRGDDAKRIKNALAVLKAGPNLTLEAHAVTVDANIHGRTENAPIASNLSSDGPSVADDGKTEILDPSTVRPIASTAMPAANLSRPSSLMPSPVPIKPPSVIPSAAFLNLSQEIGHVNDRLTELGKNVQFLNDDVTQLRDTLGIERQLPTIPVDPLLDDENKGETELLTVDGKVSKQVASVPESTATPMIAGDKEGKVLGIQKDIAPSREASSVSNRRSIIAGVDLNALKTDVAELKTEMSQTRKDIEMIKSHIHPTSSSTLDKDSSVGKPSIKTSDDGAMSTDDDEHSFEHGVSDAKDINVSTNRENVTSQENELSDNKGSSDGSSSSNKDSSSASSKKRYSKSSSESASDNKSKETIDDKHNGDGNKDAAKAELTEAVQNMEIIYSEAVRNLEFRVAELEKELQKLNETLSSKKTDEPERIQEIQALVTKMQGAYGDIEKINQVAARLTEEDEKKDSHQNVIMEQIELLKTIKADREDLEDALADKADATIVNKKVSYDRFNNACGDLARGLEDAINKLAQQEYIWQQSLDFVQQEIDNKLDRVEMSPIQEFINNRLQLLQEKIRELAAKKRENEAAGTRKVLTGLQCISCDKDAVMRIEQGSNYQRIGVQPNRNIKPYLTYDLDSIRKQQRKFPGKNINYLNTAMQEMGGRMRPSTRDPVMQSSRDHFCNRYCGGSHTVTTPQQRVMRIGNLSTQWGPEVVQLSQGVVRGTDGQLYQSTSMPPGASAVSTRDVCGRNLNTCCGGQSYNPSTQQTQQNRSGSIPDSVPLSQRRTIQKDQKHSNNLPHSTPRSSSRKQPMNPELQLRSSNAPLDMINQGEYYNEEREQIDEEHRDVPPGEI